MDNKRTVISIDVDDCLLHFVGDNVDGDIGHGFIGYLSRGHDTFLKRFGFNLDRPLTRDNYKGTYFAREVLGCSADEEAVLINGFYLDDGFLNVKSQEFPQGLRPVEGAVEGVSNLVSEGYNLIANTSRPTLIEDVTRNHLKTVFPDSFGQIFSSNGHVISDVKKSKGDIARVAGAMVHIDDGSSGLTAFLDFGVPVIILSAPWNQHFKKVDEFLYAEDWEKVVEHVARIRG